jgi:hypothetical protein
MGEINEKKRNQNITKASWWVDGNNNACYYQTLCGRVTRSKRTSMWYFASRWWDRKGPIGRIREQKKI